MYLPTLSQCCSEVNSNAFMIFKFCYILKVPGVLKSSPPLVNICVSRSAVSNFLSPWTVVPQEAPLSMGFSRQEYRSGLPFPSPGYLPNIGSEPRSPSLQADSLPSEPPGIQTHYDLNKRSLFSLVQSLSHVQFFATPWTAAHQASLPITNFGAYSN